MSGRIVRNENVATPGPVFIGGCPRSGTTLLGSVLGAHPACLTTPESQFKSDLSGAPARRGSLADEVRRHWRFRLWDVELLADPAPDDARDATLAAVRSYASAHGRAKPYRWVDHTPANLRHARTLLDWFPQARFVHLIRDPRATAASVMPLSWGPNSALVAAMWWQRHVATALAAEAWLGAGRVHRMSYEALVRDPEGELRAMLEFLGLPWSERVLTARGFEPPAYTRSQHVLVRTGFDPRRITNYRTALRRRELEVIEAAVGATMQLLAYEVDTKPGRRVVASDLVRALATEGWRRVGNRVRERRRRRSIPP